MQVINGNAEIISGENTLVKIFNEVQRIPLDIFRWHHHESGAIDYDYLSFEELREQYERTNYYKRSSNLVQDGQLLTVVIQDAQSGLIYQSGRGGKRKEWVLFGTCMGYL